MIGRSSGNMDYLAAERLHKLRIFPLRINDDHIGIRGKNHILDLALCGKGLAAARYAEDKGITVKELLAVGDNHILADNILPVVDTVLVKNILHSEGDKHGETFGREGTEGINLPYTKRHNRIQPVHLLKF